MVILIVVVALILLVGLIFILIRNGIIGSRNRVDESWSGIDVQLKRRHDLVPNLVETVKGYATHEQQTFSSRHPGPRRRDEGAERRGDAGAPRPSSPAPSPTSAPSPSSTRTCAPLRTSSSSPAT